MLPTLLEAMGVNAVLRQRLRDDRVVLLKAPAAHGSFLLVELVGLFLCFAFVEERMKRALRRRIGDRDIRLDVVLAIGVLEDGVHLDVAGYFLGHLVPSKGC